MRLWRFKSEPLWKLLRHKALQPLSSKRSPAAFNLLCSSASLWMPLSFLLRMHFFLSSVFRGSICFPYPKALPKHLFACGCIMQTASVLNLLAWNRSCKALPKEPVFLQPLRQFTLRKVWGCLLTPRHLHPNYSRMRYPCWGNNVGSREPGREAENKCTTWKT